jgi:hypothetical protein
MRVMNGLQLHIITYKRAGAHFLVYCIRVPFNPFSPIKAICPIIFSPFRPFLHQLFDQTSYCAPAISLSHHVRPTTKAVCDLHFLGGNWACILPCADGSRMLLACMNCHMGAVDRSLWLSA